MTYLARLTQAISEGPEALRALRSEVPREDHGKLAEALSDAGPASVILPWVGYFQRSAGQLQQSIEAYRSWLETAEAPAAFHLGELARAELKAKHAEGVRSAVALFHPWDLAFEPREVAARALVKAQKIDADPGGRRPLRVALLSTFTTTPLEACLRVGAARLGVEVDLWVAEFDQLRFQVADPNSELYAHRPEVVIVATSWRDVTDRPVDAQADEWLSLWETIHSRTGAHILQHTFDRDPTPSLGHLAARAAGQRRRGQQLNEQMAERAPAWVSLVDYDQVVYEVGSQRFFDTRQWHWAKEAVSVDAAPYVVEEYLAVLRPFVGKSKKLLLLDLDNTMWGGVVGEDGVENLKVGPPSIEGEAHLALQRYAKQLKERGVLLAVCSKNNAEDGREPFQTLPDMHLKLDDFVAFEASWDPKPLVAKRIAKQLNIGLDSFVFVDDNPAERARMRQEAPEVLTIPVGDDAAEYVQLLHRARAFEELSLSSAGAGRTAQYQAEAKRQELAKSFESLEEFYTSLEMVAAVREFNDADQARVVQLAARSNQFNLTTWRISPGDFQEIRQRDDRAGATFRLKDRFGDHGLVMVLVAEAKGTDLEVLAYFMSCRVIGRTMEDLAVAELDRMARALGCNAIRGVYKPTKKNRKLVADLYPRLGFDHVSGEEGGETVWRRELGPEPITNPYIEIERN